jgi:transcriptional regulator PpsR
VKAFRTPETALGNIDAEAAAALISAAADIALILDEDGVIHDVSIADQGLVDELAGHTAWPGRKWIDTVRDDSRTKVEQLLAEAASKGEPRWRHVNHPAADEADVPVLYAVVRSGVPGRIVAFGRDLRAVSSLQRRLIDAQQSLERDYVRIRHVETRYRLLFQMASDAVLIVDSATSKVLDSNPTARRLFGASAEPGSAWPPHAAFAGDSGRSVEMLLAGVRASGRADDVRAKLADGDDDVVVSASLFRDDAGVACLVRVAPPRGRVPGGGHRHGLVQRAGAGRQHRDWRQVGGGTPSRGGCVRTCAVTQSGLSRLCPHGEERARWSDNLPVSSPNRDVQVGRTQCAACL